MSAPAVLIPYRGGMAYLDDLGRTWFKTDPVERSAGWCFATDQQTVLVRCGGCGFPAPIMLRHQLSIAPDGTMALPLFHNCSPRGIRCGWHVIGILEGWHGVRPRTG